MKLTAAGLSDKQAWLNAPVLLPGYDPAEIAANTRENPRWLHFGIGNIFRIFIGTIADTLIAAGDLDSGITCAETFDFEVVDKVYAPHDNLALCVTLYGDGTAKKQVIGSLGEAIAVKPQDEEAYARLARIFASPSLQMVSYTITEKGYALKKADGTYFPEVAQALKKGPGYCSSAVVLTASMLYHRWLAGAAPVAIVSMDNVSHNGEKLRSAVLEVIHTWYENGLAEEPFVRYVENESLVSFPWTMIDKITPRPSVSVKEMLEKDGIEDMDIVITEKQTYIAPFVNAEGPQYLVIEDSFPNGRPPLQKAGVYMTDRETVNACERMKVTVCLNPLHTALAPLGCVLGYQRFSDVMRDPQLKQLCEKVGEEGMAVVKDPKILSPRAFIRECIDVRFPNEYIPDTPQRIAVDTSQMVGIRFGETIKEYVLKDGSAAALKAIPLAIAGWLRYLKGVQDDLTPFELSPDPMNEELQGILADVNVGEPESLKEQLRPVLSNAHIFGSDLYEAGIGGQTEEILRSMLEGKGAVRRTLIRCLDA